MTNINTTAGTTSSAWVATQSTNSTNNADVNTVNEDNSENVVESSTIEISTRAQYIQKLNDEFFPNGSRHFSLSSAFVDRLEEYGLINAADAEKIKASDYYSSTFGKGGDSSSNTTSLDKLSDGVTGLIEKLNNEDPSSEIIAALTSSLDILANFDNYPNSGKSTSTIISKLENFLVEEGGETLNEDEVSTLTQLDLVLQISQKMNSAELTSNKISAYLDIYLADQ